MLRRSFVRSGCRGSVLVLTLALTALMAALTLAGFERTQNQSQLAATLMRQTLLQTASRNALATAAQRVRTGAPVRTFIAGCPDTCDWRNARVLSSTGEVATAYIAQTVPSSTNRVLITTRAAHSAGDSAITHALFDLGADVFRFIQ